MGLVLRDMAENGMADAAATHSIPQSCPAPCSAVDEATRRKEWFDFLACYRASPWAFLFFAATGSAPGPTPIIIQDHKRFNLINI